MVQFKVLHYRRWRQVNNHMDCRHCPECGATVNGTHGQHAHQKWHDELAGLLDDLSERAGLDAEDDGTPWTAVVDDGQAETGELED
jgi:hypothetical protein